MVNYFEALGLEPIFDLDLGQLEQQYFAAQRQYHPDRFIGKSDTERAQAVSQSMLINEAYQALKDPLKRAKHILALNGISVGDEKAAVKPDFALLEEIMELREKVASLNSSNEVKAMDILMETRRDQAFLDLSKAFSQKDLQKAAQLSIRLGYLLKILDEIRIQTKRFA